MGCNRVSRNQKELDSGGSVHCPLHGDGFVWGSEVEELRLSTEQVKQIEAKRYRLCPICQAMAQIRHMAQLYQARQPQG